jgi:hypothetical protein
VTIDENIGQLAGEYLRQFSKSHNLKIADALIAVSAAQNQAAFGPRHAAQSAGPLFRSAR